MARRWLTNLLLLLVLALLGLGIRHELAREGRPQTLAGLDPADLRLIEVERDGESPIRLERGPERWRLLEPLQVDADPSRLERLLAILGAPVQRSFPEQSADLAALGLAPAKLRLRLDGLTLAFGGLDPLTQQRYVGLDGLVHLIEDRFYHLLIAPPVDFASRSLLPAGQPPAFATLGGVPLATASLGVLANLIAERVEPLAGDLTGEPFQVKFGDGRAIRFLVSEDRRRWSRLDQRLRYVLTDGPVLDLDPGASDPTPPEPPPGVVDQEPAAAPTAGPLPMRALGPDDPGVLDDREADPDDPFTPLGDPDAPALEGMRPPEVRLRPDSAGEGGEFADDEGEDEGGFGAEPYKDPPQGFGTDPFAPDPAYDAEYDGGDR
jgi:hypothetical protein